MTSRTATLLAGAAGFAFIIATNQAMAAQINVSATVPASCSVDENSAPELTFGEYNGQVGNSTTTDFVVLCSEDTTVAVTLDGGQNENGTRRMINSSDINSFLGYELYNGSVAGNDVWVQGTSRIIGSGPGGALVVVGGSIASGLVATSGSYSDVVEITLEVQ